MKPWNPNRRNIAIVLAGLVVVSALVLYKDRTSGHANPSEMQRFAAGTTKEELQVTLDWYVDNALGALQPPHVYMLELPGHAVHGEGNDDSASRVFEILADVDVFERLESESDRQVPWYVRIRNPYRSQLWWPGVPASPRELYYSPVRYKIVSVDQVTTGSYEGLEILTVSFTWQIEGLSLFYQLLHNLDLVSRLIADDRALSLEHWESIVGEQLSHTVVLQRGHYGYFLPLTREPLPPL